MMFSTSIGKGLIIILLVTFALPNLNAFGQDRDIKKDSSDTQHWIKQDLKFSYPNGADGNDVQGKVIVSYDVDSTCKVVNVRLLQGIGHGFDEEAVKAVKRMKLTYPKEQRGKCIAKYDLRQSFNIENKTK